MADALLLESGDYLLLEGGGKVLLEGQTVAVSLVVAGNAGPAATILAGQRVDLAISATAGPNGIVLFDDSARLTVTANAGPTATIALADRARMVLSVTAGPNASILLSQTQLVTLTVGGNAGPTSTIRLAQTPAQPLTVGGNAGPIARISLDAFIGTLYIFSPPPTDFYPYAGGRRISRSARNLLRYYDGAQTADPVLRLDGVYVQVDSPTEAQLAAATRVFPGGRDHPVSLEEAAELEADGFTVVVQRVR